MNMTLEEKKRKVMDKFVQKYGKVDLVDAFTIYGFLDKMLEDIPFLSDTDAERIADKVYLNCSHTTLNLNDLLNAFFKYDVKNNTETEKPAENKSKQNQEQQSQQNVTTCKCKTNRKYVSETDDAKIVKYLLPGIGKANINLEMSSTEINVSLKDIVIETPFVNPDFSDAIVIDETMDAENIKAKLELGILTITIPKKVVVEEEKRQIKIN